MCLRNFAGNLFFSCCFIFFLSACGSQNKLIAHFKPAKKVKLNMTRDAFLQDISFLFIVDTSESMMRFQTNLANNVNLFLKPIFVKYPHYNYNIAVTSMTPSAKFSSLNKPLSLTGSTASKCGFQVSSLTRSAGSLGSYIRYSINDQKKFSYDQLICLVSHNIVGAEGFDGMNESFFQSISYIINQSNGNFKNDFFGEDKLLVLFFLSDAYEGVDFKNRGRSPDVAQEMAYEKLGLIQSVMGESHGNIYSYAVVTDDRTGEECGEANGQDHPFHLYEFIERVKGFRISICDTEWGPKLTAVYHDFSESFYSKTLFLDEAPKINTLEVFLNGERVPKNPETGWVFNPENLSIDFGKKFDISTYTVDGKTIRDYDVVIKYNPVNIELLRKEKD